MKHCLVDVNVWFAVVVVQHVHHELAMRWFHSLAASEAGMCRIVQLGLVRLLANPSAMGQDTVSGSAAWKIAKRLIEDERVEFVPEPAGIDATMPALLKYQVPTGKLVTDAYLAAFAIASSRQLITLDRGFRQFKGLDVKIMGRENG